MKRVDHIATVWQKRNGKTVWRIKRAVYEKNGEQYIRIYGSYYTPARIVEMGYGVDIGVI